MPSPIRRRGPAVLLLLFAALLLPACGGGGSDPDVEKLLDRAFSKSFKSADVKLAIQFDLDGEGFGGPLRVRASGPFRNLERKLPALDMTIQISGVPLETGLVSTGDRVFLKFQDVYYEPPRSDVEAANRDIRENSKRSGSLKALGLDPRGWIGESEMEGDEDVAGVETQHVSGKLDVGAALRDVNDFVKRSGDTIGEATGQAIPDPLSNEDIKTIEDVVDDPSFEVYVGKDDDVIRRVSTRIVFDVPEEERSQLADLEGGEISLSLELSDVNGEQRIEAPAKARPLADLITSLGGSALGDLGGSGDEPPSSTAPSDSDAQKRYRDCVDKADPGDTDAILRCSELLQ